MADLAERVETRLRAEWPGHHTTDKRGLFEVPHIRDGGATDALVKLAAQIVREEVAEHDREVREACALAALSVADEFGYGAKILTRAAEAIRVRMPIHSGKEND